MGDHSAFNISIDNQATIKSIGNNRAQPAQYIIDEIKTAIKRLLNENQRKRRGPHHRETTPVTISLTWVAGHMGSTGNEAADALAKAATEFGSSDKNLLPTFLRDDLPSSVSAIKQNIESITARNSRRMWKRSKRYRQINAIDSSLPSRKFMTITGDLSRKQTSLLTQLRIGHVPLNKYLHRISRSETPFCQHCPTKAEDVPHLLFSCTRYAHQRHRLVTALRRKANDISCLLSDPTAIRHTLNFLHNTGRFEHLYGDISAEICE